MFITQEMNFKNMASLFPLMAYPINFTERDAPWKCDNYSAGQDTNCFYENRSFINVFTKSLRLTIFWACWIQFTSSYSVSLRYSLIFSYIHVYFFSNWSLSSRFWDKFILSFSFHPCVLHTRPSYPSLFNHPYIMKWRMQIMKFLVM